MVNTMVHFFKVFGLILLYMLVWMLLLLPVGLAANSDDAALIVLLVMVLLILVLFVPFLNLAIRWVFHFRGRGTAVAEAELRQALRMVNDLDVPVVVEERKGKLVITWRYVDAHWWEILARAGLTKVYECHVKLNEKKKEAILIDVSRSVAWRAGPTQVKLQFAGMRGVEMGFEMGKQWAFNEHFRPGKVYDYKFSPQEIKNPVLNTILEHGWNVRFGMW